MDRPKRTALIAELAGAMQRAGSWSGETHFQKTSFFVQDALGVPIGYDYQIYKYGPYSFDLHDDLTFMRGNGLIELVPKEGFGPELRATSRSDRLRARFPKTLAAYADQIEWAAEQISVRGVGDLERLGTALFIIKREGLTDPNEVANRLVDIKPHVGERSALSAAQEVEQLLDGAPVV